MKSWINKKILSILQKIEDKKYAIEMYGYDAWGTSAFRNIDKMEELRKEIKKLEKSVSRWRFFEALIYKLDL